MSLGKVRVQLLDENTGAVLKEVDVLTSADAVTFADGQTFQQKLDNGTLRGATGAQGAQGVQGAQGEPFSIAKIYSSVAAMNSGYATDGIAKGKFVIITTSDVNDADNAKLYVKGTTAYTFVTDLSGARGIQGPQGVQGIQGPKGDTGATGAKGDTGSQGSTGAKGSTGVSMRLKGAWSSTVAYVNDGSYIDIVTSGGNSYACKVSNTNVAVTDTTKWTLIASKGATGAQGAQGPKGDTGATGAQGPKGDTGAKGATGAQGAQGPKGADGESVKVGSSYATGTVVKLFLKEV